jgi:hypothetical protein
LIVVLCLSSLLLQIPFCYPVSLFANRFAMANALRELALPVLDYFSSLFRREDGHITTTANHVLLLEEHRQSMAQRRIAADGTTTSSNVDSNTCDAPDRSDSHIEASCGSREGIYGTGAAITHRDKRDGCHGCLIDPRGEAQELVCCRNCFGVAAKALSNEGEPTSLGINHGEVCSEDGDLDPFDSARSDGGDICCFAAARSDGCVEGRFDVAAPNNTRSEGGDRTCVDGVSATALSGGGGLGFDSLSGRGVINGSFARGELGALADTLSEGGDCGNNVASNEANSDRVSICFFDKRNNTNINKSKSIDEAQAFRTTLNTINGSIDEPQSFDTTSFVLYATGVNDYTPSGGLDANFEEGKKVSNVHCNLNVNASCTSKCKRKRRYKDIAPAEDEHEARDIAPIPKVICLPSESMEDTDGVDSTPEDPYESCAENSTLKFNLNGFSFTNSKTCIVYDDDTISLKKRQLEQQMPSPFSIRMLLSGTLVVPN